MKRRGGGRLDREPRPAPLRDRGRLRRTVRAALPDSIAGANFTKRRVPLLHPWSLVAYGLLGQHAEGLAKALAMSRFVSISRLSITPVRTALLSPMVASVSALPSFSRSDRYLLTISSTPPASGIVSTTASAASLPTPSIYITGHAWLSCQTNKRNMKHVASLKCRHPTAHLEPESVACFRHVHISEKAFRGPLVVSRSSDPAAFRHSSMNRDIYSRFARTETATITRAMTGRWPVCAHSASARGRLVGSGQHRRPPAREECRQPGRCRCRGRRVGSRSRATRD